MIPKTATFTSVIIKGMSKKDVIYPVIYMNMKCDALSIFWC